MTILKDRDDRRPDLEIGTKFLYIRDESNSKSKIHSEAEIICFSKSNFELDNTVCLLFPKFIKGMGQLTNVPWVNFDDFLIPHIGKCYIWVHINEIPLQVRNYNFESLVEELKSEIK